jgi:hypothetical protein
VTTFLPVHAGNCVQTLKAIGPTRVVSADIAVWTDFPWVNPAHPGFAEIDFVNVMTYFWDVDGSVAQYVIRFFGMMH